MEKDNNMIALRSGYYFMIFDIDDVPFWEQLVNTNKRVSLDGVECDLYEVPTWDIATMIDDLMGEDFKGYPIKDYIVELKI